MEGGRGEEESCPLCVWSLNRERKVREKLKLFC